MLSIRYLRAVRRSRTRSALIPKCSKQPSVEVRGEKKQGDDASDLTETVEGEVRTNLLPVFPIQETGMK